LAVAVRVWRLRHGHHLFPGGATRLPHELVEPWPQEGEQRIDHRTAGIQQTQRLGLRLVWQPHIVAQRLLIMACTHVHSYHEHLSLVAPV
jgi:hypothetical protein